MKIKVYDFFVLTGFVIAKFMNFILKPNPYNGEIKFYKILLWICFNILFLILIIYFFQSALYLKFTLLMLLLLFYMLLVSSKLLILKESNNILEGFLKIEKAKFRSISNSIPTFIVIISILIITFIFSELIYTYNEIHPGKIINNYQVAGRIDYFSAILGAIFYVENIYNMTGFYSLVEFKKGWDFLFKALINSTIILLCVYVVRLKVQQYLHIKSVIKALKSDESEIEYIQRRIPYFPGVVKKKILDIAVRDPDQKIRRRAISVMPYAKVISFPGVFIYNLHHEKDNSLKEWGLKNALKIIKDPQIKLDKNTKNKIAKTIKFQKRKQHNPRINALLKDIMKEIYPLQKRK